MSTSVSAALRIGVVGVLVLGSVSVLVESVSYAATGHPINAGGSTTETATTVLTRTNAGPALRLATKAGSPPLSVSSSTKVAHLNADLLDGKSATALGTHAITYTFRDSTDDFGDLELVFPGLAPGSYVVTWDAAPEPEGFAASASTPYTFDGSVSTQGMSTAGSLLNDVSDYLPRMSGSGLVTFRGSSIAPDLELDGSAPDSPDEWHLTDPIQVTFLPTSDVGRAAKRVTLQ